MKINRSNTKVDVQNAFQSLTNLDKYGPSAMGVLAFNHARPHIFYIVGKIQSRGVDWCQIFEIQWENVVNPQNVVFPQLCLDFSERAAQMY